jgi:hypothetical protein
MYKTTLPSLSFSCLLIATLVLACQKNNSNNNGNPIKDSTTNFSDTPVPKKYYVSTLAGTGQPGFVNGPDSSSQFHNPWTIAVDNQGNVFVGDQQNFAIRKITPGGQVSTFAGKNINTLPIFGNAFGLATDQQGNLYMADSYTWIRKITPAGINSLFAGSDTVGFLDGPDSSARFHIIFNIAADRTGNLYLPDFDSSNLFRLRKVSPAGVVTTMVLQDNTGIPSDGAPGQYNSWATAVDSAGNIYMAANPVRTVIKKITPQGVVTLLAGQSTPGQVDGKGSAAKFYDIEGLAADGSGNVYVAEGGGNDIRKVTPDGTVTTIAGLPGYAAFADGQGSSAWFNNPAGIAVDKNGIIYVADLGNNRIRRIE